MRGFARRVWDGLHAEVQPCSRRGGCAQLGAARQDAQEAGADCPLLLGAAQDSLAAMSELEGLKMALQLKDSASRALEATPFYAVKAPGTVPLSAGNLPELRWDSLQPPPVEPAGSFPGELDFFGLPLQRGAGGAAAPAAPAAPQLPALPTLSSGVKLRPASQATLSKHAILPSQSFGAAAAAAAPARQASTSAPPAQRRPLYPEFAPPEPPASSSSAGLPPEPSSVEAQLASLEVGMPGEQQQQEWPTPSPFGELQLGPQELAVQSVPQPTAPPAPGDTCCTPPAEPGSLALSEAAAPPRAGVADVKRRQSIRDVHISVALMDEFMRWVLDCTLLGWVMLALLSTACTGPRLKAAWGLPAGSSNSLQLFWAVCQAPLSTPVLPGDPAHSPTSPPLTS